MTEEKKARKVVDWAGIEREYRAGIKTLRQLAEEFGVSHVAIGKRAKAEEWPRDIKAKIDAKVQEKVNKAAVTKSVTSEHIVLTEKAVVEANATIVASAELIQREDILLGLAVTRGLLKEIALLSNPELQHVLEFIGEEMDESYTNEHGNPVRDKVNEAYRYIISLAGRVKSAKEVAATHGVYIPLQRKVLRMEDEANQGASDVDQLLAAVLAAK